MGNKKAFHSTAACYEALHVELGREKRRPQHNNARVDVDPLIAQLGEVAQQGIFQRLQMADRTSQRCLLPGLEDLVQEIDFAPCITHFERLVALPRRSAAAFRSDIPSATSRFEAAMRPCFLHAE